MKTTANQQSVEDFINSITDQAKKDDALLLIDMCKDITGEPPVMWGDSIVGFGTYHYKYESGREGDMFLTGFSPRKQNMVVYVMNGFTHYQTSLKSLGKHKTGKSCLYLKKLQNNDLKVLRDIIEASVAYMIKKYH